MVLAIGGAITMAVKAGVIPQGRLVFGGAVVAGPVPSTKVDATRGSVWVRAAPHRDPRYGAFGNTTD